MLLGNRRSSADRLKQFSQTLMVFRIIRRRISDQPVGGEVLELDLARAGKRMRRMRRQVERIPVKLFKVQTAQWFGTRKNHQGGVERPVAQAFEHLFSGEVVELDARAGGFALELAQGRWENLDSQ